MFQFPTFAHLSMWLVFYQSGFPIRISRRQGLFAPQPGFSQLITSFVASEIQGIHRLRFFYFLSLIDRSSLNVQSILSIGSSFRFSPYFLLVSFALKLFRVEYPLEDTLPHITSIRSLYFVLSINVKDLIFINSQFWALIIMWRITDSNRWPPACKAGALASWANPPGRMRNEEWRMLNFSLHIPEK